MKKTIIKNDGTKVVFEGTPEELQKLSEEDSEDQKENKDKKDKNLLLG